jgi:molybdopterin/thiamine biosynthesis adenylyltransferase
MGEINLKIIGIGGIGTILADSICRFLNYSDKVGFSRVTLVDGDEFEYKNLERQVFERFGNKASIKANELVDKFKNIVVTSIPQFVTEENIDEIIKNEDIILLCVDNHKTRKLVSDHVTKLFNLILISGGNDYVDGNVQVFIRKDGQNVTPSLTDYHPEIKNPADKSPHEMSCEELQNSEPQLIFTNSTVANIMCWAFWNYLQNKDFQKSEIYFDINEMVVDPKLRKLKTKKGDLNV